MQKDRHKTKSFARSLLFRKLSDQLIRQQASVCLPNIKPNEFY
ncbi:hypothetical protein HMPREF9103_01126 [Lentilactobacillus parafarraginis F0439]|uniref:Uncharacterized protein n=1 Tax=Lentilactobacillus parafarraginis F0439 TaxID=797515 RepID=G9ZN25_9LACO|nr:hypothetical protein HMPREF9103_01126 [Lentilactobacillus parafarraginis F0439]